MKKICISILVILGVLVSANIKVNAAQPQVNIGVIGEVKAGSNIDIVVDLENMTNLYAASMDYTYDNSLVKIDEIVVSSNIDDGNVYQYKETDNGGNRARYGYTNLGDILGFSGTSNFLVIKAKVLKDGELNLTKDNFKLMLVQKQDGLTSEMLCNYNYPKESWELVAAPTGTISTEAAPTGTISTEATPTGTTPTGTTPTRTTTYVSIEPKANSLSNTSITTDKITEDTIPEKNKSDGTTKDATNNASEVDAKDSSNEGESKDETSKEESNKDEVSNFWIVGVVVITVAAFFVYKRKSLKKNKL